MSEFIQLHLLTSYPPANLNRDDLGRPKTAMFGGSQRLRVSSQSLKRAWRTSDVFAASLEGQIGTRTKVLGTNVLERLTEKGVAQERANTFAKAVVHAFKKEKKKSDDGDEGGSAKKPGTRGKKEKPADGASPETEPTGSSLEFDQLVHVSAAELAKIDEMIKRVVAGDDPSPEEISHLLSKGFGSADVALFGRMLAEFPDKNIDAAAQVAHALSVHRVTVEDDFFTAVDDLNKGEEDRGAAHMGTVEFAAALFYQYVCINRDYLLRNLEGDEELANRTLRAFVEACATVSPSGKQNTFGSRARASYLLAERGEGQPRSLSVAFLKAVSGDDILADAVSAIEKTCERMDKVYGPCAREHRKFNVATGEGTLAHILDFVAK